MREGVNPREQVCFVVVSSFLYIFLAGESTEWYHPFAIPTYRTTIRHTFCFHFREGPFCLLYMKTVLPDAQSIKTFV
jgi:hypothetical protein